MTPITQGPISLGEGNTPLLAAPRLGERYGCELWLKWEGANPTGSFKDRGMSVATTRAVESGAHTLVCASTGNTAASCAAYAARAGLRATIVVVRGAAAGPKLAQVRAVGGEIIEVDGTFSDAFAHAEEIVARSGGSIVTVDDEQIVAARDLLGREEGVFCEPASAAGIAGLAQGTARAGERVVCVVTGHGLKAAA